MSHPLPEGVKKRKRVRPRFFGGPTVGKKVAFMKEEEEIHVRHSTHRKKSRSAKKKIKILGNRGKWGNEVRDRPGEKRGFQTTQEKGIGFFGWHITARDGKHLPAGSGWGTMGGRKHKKSSHRTKVRGGGKSFAGTVVIRGDRRKGGGVQH